MKTSSDIRNLKQASFDLPGPFAVALFAALADFEAAAVPIAPDEPVAPKFEIVGGTLNFTVQPSVAGRRQRSGAAEPIQISANGQGRAKEEVNKLLRGSRIVDAGSKTGGFCR